MNAGRQYTNNRVWKKTNDKPRQDPVIETGIVHSTGGK